MQCFQCPALRSGRLASRRAARILAMQHQQQASITKLRRTAVPLYPPLSSSPGFKVVQWNILADGLAQSGDFVKVPPSCLEWEHRLPLVLQELQEADADIVCVQELNRFEELQRHLEPIGYEGVFLAKNCSPAARYNCPADGLAVFHRKQRFNVVSKAHGQHYTEKSGECASQGYLHVVLEDVQSGGRQLVVATTHLKAKEGADMDEIRLRQMQQLLRGISQDLERLQPHGNNNINGNGNGNGNGIYSSNGNGNGRSHARHSHVPVIITGDFNTTPNSSPCQLLMAHPAHFRSIWDVAVGGADDPQSMHAASAGSSSSNGTSSMGSSDQQQAAVQGAGTGGSSQNGAGPHNNGASKPSVSPSTNGSCDAAGSSMDGCGGPLSSGEFSTWKFRSKGESKRIIDHMWWTEGRGLRPISRWRMLNENEIGPSALPSLAYASDHIALCTEFEWV